MVDLEADKMCLAIPLIELESLWCDETGSSENSLLMEEVPSVKDVVTQFLPQVIVAFMIFLYILVSNKILFRLESIM